MGSDFSKRVYVAPFGRYEAGGEAESPADQVLVGREGQRAYFIDLLLKGGRRGAYLVTGHRGVGKSSFVRHCLGVYRKSVFDRALRSNVGRATFWDRILILGLLLLVILVALLLSELAELITLGFDQSGERGFLLWAALVPVAILCLYPLLYATDVAQRIFRYRFPLPIGISVLSSSCLLWFLEPFGAPALSMSRLLVALAFMHFLFWCTPHPLSDTKGRDRRSRLWLLVPLSITLLYVWQGPVGIRTSPLLEYYGNIGLALELWGLAGLWSWHLRSASERNRLYFLVWPGFAVALALLLTCWTNSWWALATGLIVVALCILVPLAPLYLQKELKPRKDENVGGLPDLSEAEFRAKVLILSKVFMAVVISLQLLHPVIAMLSVPRAADGVEIEDLGTGPSEASSLSEVPGLSIKFQRKVHERSIVFGSPLACEPFKPPSPRCDAVSMHYSSRSKVLPASISLSGRSIFPGKKEELRWLFCVFLAAILIFLMEHDWIARPCLLWKNTPSAENGASLEESKDKDSVGLQGLAELTLPWLLLKEWLPVVVTSVNLGFERLDHRRVVHAMLVSLRTSYHRAFLAWHSVIANLGRLLGLMILLILVAIAGDYWFAMPGEETVDPKKLHEVAAGDYKNICSLFSGSQRGAGAVNVLCKLGGDRTVHVMNFNIASVEFSAILGRESRHLLFSVVPFSADTWPTTETLDDWNRERTNGLEFRPLLNDGLHVRVYHILLFVLFFVVGKIILRRLPIFPYKEVLRTIDEVTDQLSSSTSITSTSSLPQLPARLQVLLADERIRQVQSDPVDPRTVELLFLHILEEIQSSSIALPGAKNQRLSLPTPELVFVFDELDKLGGSVEFGMEAPMEEPARRRELMHAERRRSGELHRLMADMKNLLASAPARFIFVGGRNLHDEWLADQTGRTPLLTNIFNAEVYLPSLLTDYPSRSGLQMHTNIEAYIGAQHRRARKLYQSARRKERIPAFSLQVEDLEAESFTTSSPATAATLLQLYSNDCISEYPGQADELQQDLAQFLAYRSKGNPKRLRELFSNLIRPIERVIEAEKVSKIEPPCEHVLKLDDVTRFRVQIIARLYRLLARTFQARLPSYDDKLVMSVLFLSDFLFKFHRRAFSWSNLERVDELAHIHRAPDLREVLETLVMDWMSRILHPIRNGMYDFRFLSEMAREIEYISRESQEEMAAFNFTLDESLALKSIYEVAIERLSEKEGEKKAKELGDLISGLGELYEFDQEYETARIYYRRAVSLLDQDLREMAGGGEQKSAALEIMGASQEGQQNARLYMTWGIARLRLMLQIGMTYELTRNYERAEVEYRNAYSLARSLLLAMLDAKGREAALYLDITNRPNSSTEQRLQELKHLSLLFQPVFAEAWLGEKLPGAVDTSIALVERELWELRQMLPFVRESTVSESTSPVDIRNANFALIVSEMHNKAGDLFFMKGRQARTPLRRGVIVSRFRSTLNGSGKATPRTGQEGYLLQAHYHYCVTLHELRRYVAYRWASSKNQLNIWTGGFPGERWETLSKREWPSAIYSAAGEALNDIAEAMLGRISFRGLIRHLDTMDQSAIPREPAKGFTDRLKDACEHWMDSARTPVEVSPCRPGVLFLDGYTLNTESLDSWLGVWTKDKEESSKSDDYRLLDYDNWGSHDDATRLVVAINFMLVGAAFLAEGGFLEDSAREYLKVAETVGYYLWWASAMQRLRPADAGEPARKVFWTYLVEVSVDALKGAEETYERSRSGGSFKTKDHPVRNVLPTFMPVVVCSLGLAGERLDLTQNGELEDLFRTWTGRARADEKTWRDYLEEALVRYSYPMKDRLYGLSVLIQDAAMRKETSNTELLEGDALKWVQELKELHVRLAAPLYSTPFSTGVSYGLVAALGWRKDRSGESREKLSAICKDAVRDLTASQEMISLGAAYYENISGLFYLYDDFNDRQVHFNRAIQMAGCELASMLLESQEFKDLLKS